ncbi:MAG: Holliday junction DNA helicase RuvA [Kiritimatiellia bacterium]|jgi:Holliday junction DNA helicase RuvA
MIGMLRGKVVWRSDASSIFDVNGVGYEIRSPSRALDVWQASDEEVTAYVSTQVREDAITLFAFASHDDKLAFHILLGVNKVGPKLALACLDALALADLRHAVETDDVTSLCRIAGVGKRTAQRLALELKGKLPAGAFTPSSARSAVRRVGPDAFELAMARLGFSRAEISLARTRVTDAGVADDAPVAERLRVALKTSLRT